jgi:mRNA interferase RelE/StbE
MADYSISFKRSVEKDLRHLPQDLITRVMEKIESLKSEPFPSQSIRISGAERLYRLRVGDYRIIYEVDSKTKEIIIHHVRDRSIAYRCI